MLKFDARGRKVTPRNRLHTWKAPSSQDRNTCLVCGVERTSKNRKDIGMCIEHKPNINSACVVTPREIVPSYRGDG